MTDGGTGLSRYNSTAARTGDGPLSTIPGQSLDHPDWSGPVLSLDSLGTDLPDLGGEVVGEMLRATDGVVRRGTTYLRRKIGWRAQRGGILLVRLDQALQPRSDGRFSPAGEWQSPTTTVYRVGTSPSRRVGEVPVDWGRNGDAPGAVPSERAMPVQFRDAEYQLGYLPATVRRGLGQQVPTPWLMEAQAIRHTRSDGSVYHRVVGLLLGTSQGVVVSASRQSRAPTWQVQQVRYEFVSASGAQAEGGVPAVPAR